MKEPKNLRQALEAITYASDDGSEYEHNEGCEGEAECAACWALTIRQALAAHPAEPAPVVATRDAYSDQMNLELRQSIAANVLEAMDVDQYLIDAVRNAVPAESADEWARLDGANADEDTRARLTEMLSTTLFHCFDGKKLGLSAMQAMAVADALVSAGARFDEVAS